MKWYLYALAGARPGPLPCGMGGQSVFALPHRGIWLVASEWAEGGTVALGPGGVLTHERVVEAVMAAASVLPLRFGTVGERQVCLAFVDRHEAAIRRRLVQVAGRVEVTLRILAAGAGDGAGGGPADGADPADGAPPPAHGAGYLRQRHAQVRQEAARAQQTEALVAGVETSLDPWIVERHHRLLPSGRTLAVLNHLIPAEVLSDWVQAVQRMRGRFPGYDFMASGPWPPYHFAEVKSDDGELAESDSGPA